jgi:hypothetical protein
LLPGTENEAAADADAVADSFWEAAVWLAVLSPAADVEAAALLADEEEEVVCWAWREARMDEA